MSKSENRQRTALLPSVRCFPEEKAQVIKNATSAGLSTGEYIRRSALGRRIVARGDTRQMNEILKMGGLLKHLYLQAQQEGVMTKGLSKEFAEALAATKIALLRFNVDSPIHEEEDNAGSRS